MSELFAPVCSIATTKRRKFFWAAWWSGPPTRAPFRKPDALGGGARSREEALSMAEKAAGLPLVVVEPLWAKAVLRTTLGLPPFATTEADPKGPVVSVGRDAPSVWALLGVSQTATPAEVKRAFRKRALETHPDHGGDALMFQKVRAAYDEALRRSARPRKQAKKPKPG